MDTHEVTVKEFEEFVKATNYITVAEMDIDWEELKKQLPAGTSKPNEESLKAGSLLFKYLEKKSGKENLNQWWFFRKGVSWKNPNGLNPKLSDIYNHPVTHISWYDALAYAKWVGKRLPSEAEYEYAMRGGEDNTMYPWGNKEINPEEIQGNFFQGDFPYINSKEDGFEKVAPVMSFQPNAYGLYDISGNVWEWTMDWYSAKYYLELEKMQSKNPKGPNKTFEVYNANATHKVVRGGSFLCNDSWCSGYRNARRMRLSPDSGMEHLGFRLVRDVMK
jgi:formylglycine-generating enzyme required for sulfatase activity